MLVNDADHDTLRRLAEVHADGAKVISIYIDRDPETFASPRALLSEVRSVLDEAGRREDVCAGGLDHDALTAARADVERLRQALLDLDDDSEKTFEADLELKGARALAL